MNAGGCWRGKEGECEEQGGPERCSLLQTCRSNGGAKRSNKVTTGSANPTRRQTPEAISSMQHQNTCIDSFVLTPVFFSLTLLALIHTHTVSWAGSMQRRWPVSIIFTHHISKVVCCVITPSWPATHEIRHLSLSRFTFNCFVFLHTESSIGIMYHFAVAGRCNYVFTDLSLPLLSTTPLSRSEGLRVGDGVKRAGVSVKEARKKDCVCWLHPLKSGNSHLVV